MVPRPALVLGLALLLPQCGAGAPDPSEAAAALEQISRSGRGLPFTPAAEERSGLRQLYERSGYNLLWVSPRGELRRPGKEALQRLGEAGTEGLRPEDYGSARLDSLAARVARQRPIEPLALAQLDAGLSVAVLRYLRHIHDGRINPRRLGFALDPPRERHDYAALLLDGLRHQSFEDVVAELAPALPQYRLVRSALAHYRSRYDSVEVTVPIRTPVEPGDSLPAPSLAALERRLAQTGDLAGSAGANSAGRYQSPLVEAVRRFQGRHSLPNDGRLSPETVRELNVPLSWRIHQLELALERLRWLRDLGNEPFVLVNIPMFELTAWSSPQASGPPLFRTGVIVGKALDTQTPVLEEEMRYLVFQPYWNVPPSIARNEIIPAIEKDPAYLAKNDMEIVDGQGDDAGPVPVSAGALDRVDRGELRIRQRPGPRNALGAVKFVFPNDQNIYLHGTPARELFDRSRRDFSHGCVRVEDPIGLAEWVLSGDPSWDRSRIVEAMEQPGRISRRVSLPRPLKVVLFYSSAMVESDGTVRFARDIYGHDQRLDRALHAA